MTGALLVSGTVAAAQGMRSDRPDLIRIAATDPPFDEELAGAPSATTIANDPTVATTSPGDHDEPDAETGDTIQDDERDVGTAPTVPSTMPNNAQSSRSLSAVQARLVS